MSHRRWRQSVAPGVSPGDRCSLHQQPSKRATEISVAPAGLWSIIVSLTPGLRPGLHSVAWLTQARRAFYSLFRSATKSVEHDS